MAKTKKADSVRQLFNLANNWTRKQWEITNQKGYDFSHDEQISKEEKDALEAQGMPTFTINRILPVVEMLNFYATANTTIPNDQKGFAEFCFGQMPSCKEGDGLQCLKDNPRYTNY